MASYGKVGSRVGTVGEYWGISDIWAHNGQANVVVRQTASDKLVIFLTGVFLLLYQDHHPTQAL